jgi:hypothetical protein
METPQKQPEFEAKVIESLPEKPTKDQDASDIKGGRKGVNDGLDEVTAQTIRER